MRAQRLVLPLAILAGALFLAPHSSGKQTNSKPPPSKTSKKESRMNQRDREMDRRMKQKKTH
jgi:hypothetical protein